MPLAPDLVVLFETTLAQLELAAGKRDARAVVAATVRLDLLFAQSNVSSPCAKLREISARAQRVVDDAAQRLGPAQPDPPGDAAGPVGRPDRLAARKTYRCMNGWQA